MARAVVMALLLLVSWGIFAYSAHRRWRLMRVARAPDDRFDRIGERVKSVLVYMFGQRRMPRYPLAGWAHMAVFFGFIVLLLNSLILWGRGFFGPHFAFGLFSLHQPLGLAYAFVRDIFTVLVIAGVLILFWNRVIARLGRLTLSAEGVLILAIIFVMMIADLVYEGTYINQFEGGRFLAAVPFGSLTGRILSPLPAGAQAGLMHTGFWTHSILVLLFLNLLPYGKHFHVVTVLPNVFFRRLGPSGRVPPIVDIEGRLEREETLGARRVQDFSWKAALDLYTCTECGRCTDQCPAARTGKLLSPKHLTIALRDHMYLREEQLIGPRFYAPSARAARRGMGPGTAAAAARTGSAAPNGAPAAGPDYMHAEAVNVGEAEPGCPPAEPAGAGSAAPACEPYTGDPPGKPHGTRDRHGLAHDPAAPSILHTQDLTPAWISPEVLWACTTCGACEQECPVFITYIDKILDLRRHLVMERGEFPEQLQQTFKGLETVGNPYSFSPEQRAEWAAGLSIPLRAEKPDADWLFWVGCAPSFDDRSRKIARATAELLQEAGVDFAILGPEEQCTGDPARRAGNEYLFQMLAQANIETLNRYNVNKIVTTCPHCYHTLKNEYSDFGGHYELFHHTELLAQLVRQGRLRPRFPVRATIAYHDACYLGRHNQVYDAPREIINQIPGARVALPPESRDRGMCCGAGGAQMWKEEEHGDARVNHTRVKQLLRVIPGGGTGPSTDGTKPTIATACPFCMTMLTDGCRDQGFDEVQQLDVAEILHRAVKGPKEAQNTAEASAAQPA